MFSLKWHKTKRRNTSSFLLVVLAVATLCFAGYISCPKDWAGSQTDSKQNQSLNDLPCHKNTGASKADSPSTAQDTCHCSEDLLHLSVSIPIEMYLKIQVSILVFLDVKNLGLASLFYSIFTSNPEYPAVPSSRSYPLRTVRLII